MRLRLTALPRHRDSVIWSLLLIIVVLTGMFLTFCAKKPAPSPPPAEEIEGMKVEEEFPKRTEKVKEELPEEVEKVKEVKPEYVIEANPKQSRDPLVLKPNIKTTVTFYIGPRSDESLTPGEKPDITLWAFAKGQPLDLTVTLYCDISEKDTYQQRKITFYPDKNQSDKAEFEIIPSSAAVSKKNGLGKLIFVVDANGMEVDIIQLNAIVGDPSQEALNNYSPAVKLSFDELLPEDISVPDILIAIAPAQGSDSIPIAIRPFNDQLLKELRDTLEDPKGEFWVFKSGVTGDDLRGRVSRTYSALLSLADQNHQELQRIYKCIGANTGLSPRVSMGSFKPEDTEKILKTLGEKGALLYWNIFKQGERGLSKAMKTINSFELQKRPLKVKILAANVYAPWQILYTDNKLKEPINPKLFWGFRYDLGTLQLINQAQGRTRTVMGLPRPDEIIFGAWRGISRDDVRDDVKVVAGMLKEHLQKRVGKEIAFCTSKDDFISRIKSGAGTTKLILAYGHGSSGTVLFIYRLPSGEPIVLNAPTVVGPYFKFAEEENETLIPEDFDKLAMSAQSEDLNPYFLKSQPIIILNACETGTSGTQRAENNGFVGSLTRTGARAVIVTEAPVWAVFAQQFGKDLIDLLLEGKEVSMALLEARLKHLEKAGNPFGLIYSLYGNPAARIKKE